MPARLKPAPLARLGILSSVLEQVAVAASIAMAREAAFRAL
jgi:hypothetical protein